ncbi:MAG TPA: hypothetical protein VK612_09360 [Pyrinomonadaceae bacterium]|nr:hypothetical protein [Pyrinomonadaceae bacterium]
MDDDFEDDDELDDITAIYDLGKGGLGENFNLCSPEMTEKIRRAMEEGLREARRKHKEAGVPMVISRDGKIVYIQPNEIEI